MSYISNTLEPFDFYNNIARVNKYRKVNDYLKSIKLESDKCLTAYKDSYLLSKNILLKKQIGSKSRFGVVYKCININKKFNDIPPFTIKIQLNTRSLELETKVLSKLSKYGIKNNIPNLPILYKVIKCPYNSNYKLFDGVSKNAIKNGYTMLLNELASGDLNQFLNKKYTFKLTEELWRNTYEQLFMCLAILHSFKVTHNDAHSGNFLYHKIKKGGCFHYKINDTDFYIKNLGFLWTSWDYGKIDKMKNKGSYIYDYMMLNLVTRKNDFNKKTPEFDKHDFYKTKEWGYLSSNAKVPLSIQRFQNELWKLLGGFNKDNDIFIIKKLKMSESIFIKYFLNNRLLFSKEPIGTILSSVTFNL